MRLTVRRLTSSALAAGLALGLVGLLAAPASAAMTSGCALYPESVYSSGGRTYFAATATCGTAANIAFVQAALQKGSTTVSRAPAQYSSGAASLRSSSSAACVAGSHRTFAWANDRFTGAAERGGTYKVISC